jgi:hypothetical protein
MTLPRSRSVTPLAGPPRLFVVVDTEEEFDWDASYSRENVSVAAMRYVGRAQRIFDRFRIKPTYVIDYPVASQTDGFELLRDISRDGRCTIGAHLHPWVNPPYTEEVTRRNSFTMNLSAELQRAKLAELAGTISHNLGVAPQVFKAGRYGLGPGTVAILEELGFTVDMSVCPRFDFSDQDGPDFTRFDASPFFLTSQLLEIPCTVDYTGWAGPLRPLLHRAGAGNLGTTLRALGVFSRLGVTNRIMLSPEGNTLQDMRALAQALVSRGCRTFTLSFHSPSLATGHTSYVRTEGDLDSFLATIDGFCDFFLSDLNGVPATPLEFRQDLLSSSTGTIA